MKYQTNIFTYHRNPPESFGPLGTGQELDHFRLQPRLVHEAAGHALTGISGQINDDDRPFPYSRWEVSK